VVLPDSSCNRGPWILERKHAFDAIAREQRSFLRLQNARLDTEERHSGAARLGRNSARERSDDDRTRFSLPKRVDDSTFFLSDVFIVPMPRLGINGLADGSEDPQRRQVMILDMLRAQTTKKTNRSGCRVELRKFMLRNSFPIARRRRINWGRFKDAAKSAAGQINSSTLTTTSKKRTYVVVMPFRSGP